MPLVTIIIIIDWSQLCLLALIAALFCGYQLFFWMCSQSSQALHESVKREIAREQQSMQLVPYVIEEWEECSVN